MTNAVHRRLERSDGRWLAALTVVSVRLALGTKDTEVLGSGVHRVCGVVMKTIVFYKTAWESSGSLTNFTLDTDD